LLKIDHRISNSVLTINRDRLIGIKFGRRGKDGTSVYDIKFVMGQIKI